MDSQPSMKYRLVPWFVCALGALFYSYEYLLRMSPSVMAENLMRFYHLTGAQFGYLSGSYYYYSYVLMQILVGVMMDRYGPRRLLTFACFMCAVGAYLFACSNYLAVAMVGRFLIGMGSAFAFVGAAKLATIWLKPQYFALMSGIIFCLGMIGAAFGDVVLRVIVDTEGWQTAMVSAAVAGVILSLILWTSVRDVNPYFENEHSHHTSSLSDMFSGLRQAFKNRQIWLCGFIGCLLYLFLSAFAELWGPAYLAQAHGIDRVHAANANSMVFIGCAIGAPIWGLISDFLELRRAPIIFAATAAIITFCVLIYAQHLSLLAIYIILFLFGFFILMLISSISLLSIPFIKTNTLFSRYFLISGLFIVLFSLGLYQWSNDHAGLKQWLTFGEKHYRLMEEVNQLGGLTGMILQIKKKLAINPDDAEGWFILGKLYLANQDTNNAKDALGKAMKLRPNDALIKHFYEIAE